MRKSRVSTYYEVCGSSLHSHKIGKKYNFKILQAYPDWCSNSYYLLGNTHPILIRNLCDISAKKHDDIFLMIETHNPRSDRNPKT